LAGIGLIFQKNPEGYTATIADPNWPNKHSIGYHVMSCSIFSGGAGRECSGHERVALCIPLFLAILLISIIAVTVHFLCCSVKLSLSHPMSFAYFLLYLLPTPAGGGAIKQLHGSLLLASTKP